MKSTEKRINMTGIEYCKSCEEAEWRKAKYKGKLQNLKLLETRSNLLIERKVV